MWPNNSMWSFGVGGYTPGLPQIGGGPVPSNSNLPWWAYLGEQTGFFDWVGETIFGQDPGNNGQGGVVGTPASGGYPTTTGGMPLDYVSSLLAPTLQGGEGNRQNALEVYESRPDLIQRFVSWLQTMGAVASLTQQLLTSSIFAWPKILQDLILLFFHDEPAANTVGSAVVAEANRNLGGGSVGSIGGLPGLIGQLKPPIMPAEPVMRIKSRAGYVIVRDPATGQPYNVERNLARSLKLYKPRKKPPISAKDWEAAKAGKRVENKMARMMKGSCNYKVTKKR